MTTTGAVVLLLASSNAFVPYSARPALPGRGVVRAARGAPTALLRGLESIFGAPPRDDIDYAALPGRPASWAREAGAFAVEGAVPARSADGLAVATFAGGCFWGLELAFQRVPGVLRTESGFTGGHKSEPTYKQVCAERTGHREAVRVEFDPAVVTYDELLTVFWDRLKDPTDPGGQGNDRGLSYTTAIFFEDDAQRAVAYASRERLQTRFRNEIATEILPARQWWPAEKYHQQYLQKLGQSACKCDLAPIRCYG